MKVPNNSIDSVNETLNHASDGTKNRSLDETLTQRPGTPLIRPQTPTIKTDESDHEVSTDSDYNEDEMRKWYNKNKFAEPAPVGNKYHVASVKRSVEKDVALSREKIVVVDNKNLVNKTSFGDWVGIAGGIFAPEIPGLHLEGELERFKIQKEVKRGGKMIEKHEERSLGPPKLKSVKSKENIKLPKSNVVIDVKRDNSKYIKKPVPAPKINRELDVRAMRDIKEQKKRMDDLYDSIVEATDFEHQIFGSFVPENFQHNIGVSANVEASLHNIAEGLRVEHSLSGATVTELDDFKSVLSNLTDKIPNFGQVKDDIGSLSTVVGGQIENMAMYSSAVFFLYAALTARDRPDKRSYGVLLVAFAVFAYQAGTSVVTKLKDYFIKAYRYVKFRADYVESTKMSVQLDTDQFSSIMNLAGLFLHTTVLGTMPEGKRMDKFLSLTSNFSRSTDGIKNASKIIVEFIEKVTNFVLVSLLGKESVTFLESDNLEVRGFVNSCKKLFDDTYHDKLPLTVSNGQRVYSLWATGNDLQSRYSQKENADIRNAVMTHMQPLTKIKIKFEEANILNPSIRMVPLTVCIRGSSGVGKSLTTLPLTLALLAGVVPPSEYDDFRTNHETYLYNRQNEHKYWDGYRGQWVCVFDDFAQMKDMPGVADNEYMDLIRASNIFSDILHMAGLESKGVTAFKSKFIICTTNLLRFTPTSIEQPEAVNRRFDIVVTHVPPKKYCTDETADNPNILERRLDRTKVKPGFDEDAVEYHVHNLMTGADTGEILTFEQLVMKMRMMYSKNENSHVEYKNAIDEVKMKYSGLSGKDLHVQMAPYGIILEEGDESESDTDDSDDEGGIALDDVDAYYGVWFDMQIKEVQEGILDDIKKLCAVTHRGTMSAPRAMSVLGNMFPRCAALMLAETLDPEGVTSNLAAYKVGKSIYRTRKDVDLLRQFEQGMTVILGEKEKNRIEKFYIETKVVLKNMADRVDWALSKYKGYAELKYFCRQILPYISMALLPICISYFSGLFGKLGDSLHTILEFLGLSGSLSTAKDIVAPVFAEMGSPGNFREQKRHDLKHVRAIAARAHGHSQMDAQMGEDDKVLESVIDKVIGHNTYEMWLPSHKTRSGFVTFVRGRVALMPYHFVSLMAESLNEHPRLKDTHVKLIRSANGDEYFIPFMTFLDEVKVTTHFETLDACLVKMPNSIHAHKDITKYFHDHASATKTRDMNVALICPSAKKTMILWSKAVVINDKQIGSGEKIFYVQKGFGYPANTRVGDCGSLLALVDSGSRGRKFIGIHTGGSEASSAGFSTAICYEDLMVELEQFKEETIEYMEINEKDLTFQGDFGDLADRFMSVGVSPKPLHNPMNTTFRKSEVYGCWGPPVSKPAILRKRIIDGETVDPMMKGLSSYCTDNLPMRTSLLMCAANGYEQDMKHCSSAMESRLYSFEEAILGVDGDKDYKAIARNTSPGHPWNLTPDPKNPGKTRWFGHEQDYDLSGEEVAKMREDVEFIIEDAKQYKRRTFVFSDYLKDECRPIEKVDQGKTRIISACPLDLTIVYRMYFGAYTNWLVKNKIKNGSAVGLNPYSFDWQELANRLRAKGPNIGAGDYSKFDGSEKPQIHWLILDIIQSFYNDGEENAIVRKILWEELVNSRHINGIHIYEWYSSLPSGHPLTTMVNIMYNHIAFRYCWLRANGDQEVFMNIFTDHVELCALGDDNIFSVGQEYADVYNQVTISEYMLELGLVYTDETKSGTCIPFRKLEEVNFLKRGFRIEPALNRYVAPLELSVILEMPYWTKKGSLKETITKEKFDNALLELALHGQEVYDFWFTKMMNIWVEHFPTPQLTKRLPLVLKSSHLEVNW